MSASMWLLTLWPLASFGDPPSPPRGGGSAEGNHFGFISEFPPKKTKYRFELCWLCFFISTNSGGSALRFRVQWILRSRLEKFASTSPREGSTTQGERRGSVATNIQDPSWKVVPHHVMNNESSCRCHPHKCPTFPKKRYSRNIFRGVEPSQHAWQKNGDPKLDFFFCLLF